jgi:hypothetical protein
MAETIKDIIKNLEINIIREIDRLESYTLNFSFSRRNNWFLTLKTLLKKIEAIGNEEFMSSNPLLDHLKSPEQLSIETLSNLISENKLAFDLITEMVLVMKQGMDPLENLLSKNDVDHIQGVERLKME